MEYNWKSLSLLTWHHMRVVENITKSERITIVIRSLFLPTTPRQVSDKLIIKSMDY